MKDRITEHWDGHAEEDSQTAAAHPNASIGACKAPPHENGTRSV